MAADEEGQPPVRPGSRGPRVVTGDMKRATQASRVVTGPGVAPAPPPPPPVADDDPPTETLVAPAARRPRPAPAAPAVRAPAPEPEPEPEPDPEPWESIEVTRNMPPPLHRTPAPPVPAPVSGKAPKPPKPPKPGKAPKAPGSGSGGGLALALALISLVTAGVLAIPALILAGRAKRKGGGSGVVTTARVVGVVSLLAWLAVAGVVVANVVKPDGVDYSDLVAGDCIDTPEGAEVRRLTVRPCDEPHDAEVFAVVIHPAAAGDAFPGATALLEYAANLCLGQPFTDYVGIPRGQSQLTEFEIVPESETWHDGRRGLVCAVDNADRTPLTATVKGSAR